MKTVKTENRQIQKYKNDLLKIRKKGVGRIFSVKKSLGDPSYTKL